MSRFAGGFRRTDMIGGDSLKNGGVGAGIDALFARAPSLRMRVRF